MHQNIRERLLFSLTTIILELSLVFGFNISHSRTLIIVLFMLFLLIGAIVDSSDERFTPREKNISWSFLYGTICAGVIMCAVLVTVMYRQGG